MSVATEFAPGLTIQNTTAPQKLSDYKLIAFDMDSTLITIECVDEIADATGKKAEVAAITEATMRGEITDFKDSLRQRVGKLVGVTEADMARVLTERLRLTPGADTLVRAAQAAGLKVLLVSGGFTYFAEHVRGLLGIDFVRANVLDATDTLDAASLDRYALMRDFYLKQRDTAKPREDDNAGRVESYED